MDKLKEVGITVDMFKQAFEEEREQAWEGGKQEASEEIAAKMIKDNETVTKIERYTGLSFERIADIARSLGVTSLAV